MQERCTVWSGVGIPTLLPFTDTELYNISRCGPLYVKSAEKYLDVFTTTTSPHYTILYIVTRCLHWCNTCVTWKTRLVRSEQRNFEVAYSWIDSVVIG